MDFISKIKKNKHGDYQTSHLFVIIGFIFVLSLISFFHVYEVQWIEVEIHSSLEGIGGVICVILSFFLLNKKIYKNDYPYLFLTAIVLFVLGIGDIIHSFTPLGNSFIFYHSFSGFFASLFFILLFFRQKLNSLVSYKHPFILISSLALLVYLIFVLFPDAIPPMGNDRHFSFYAITLNVVTGIVFISFAFYLLLINKKSDYNYFFLILFFTAYSVSYLTFFNSALWDLNWWLWHVMRLLAVILLIFYIVFHQKELISGLNSSNQQLIDSKKILEEKNKELEQFTYITSHDLQEPLNSILSFSYLLKENNEGKLDELGEKSIEVISQSAVRMKAFIVSLLEYSRIGRIKELSLVNINTLLSDLTSDLNDIIEREGVEINYVGKDISLYAYEIDLIKLFQNLIINAIVYKKEDQAPVINIDAKELENEYEFTIQDNGIGIKKEHYSKVFEVFQRLHTRDKYEGTGIGLAHCKRIVELHKGGIRIESEFGIGTSFIFTIKKNINDE